MAINSEEETTKEKRKKTKIRGCSKKVEYPRARNSYDTKVVANAY